MIAAVGRRALARVTGVDAFVEAAHALVLTHLTAARCPIAVIDFPTYKIRRKNVGFVAS